MLDATHFVTFLVGALVGAAGHYLGERFTDQRRAKEAGREVKRHFVEARERSEKLLNEMIEDVRGDRAGFMHEFVVLPNRNVIYNSEKDRFGYYESEHSQLQDQILLLVRAGLVTCVRELSPSKPPVFAMSTEFLHLLKSAA
jgi:hypothetical protein